MEMQASAHVGRWGAMTKVALTALPRPVVFYMLVLPPYSNCYLRCPWCGRDLVASPSSGLL